MTITQVLYVLETARQQNVSKAAENLFVSQPALSAQIRKLEEELGCELFRREHQGVSLTAAGRTFCEASKPVERAWKKLQEETKYLQNAVCRQVRIGVGPRAFSTGLVDALISFFNQHPETEVSFVTAGLLPLEDSRSSWENFPFENLQGTTVVSGSEGSLDDLVMRENCRKYGIQPGRVYRADNLDAVMSLIQRGKGIALGPRSFARRYQVAAVPVLPTTDVALCLICLRQNQRNSLVVRLKRYLHDYLSANPLEVLWEEQA